MYMMLCLDYLRGKIKQRRGAEEWTEVLGRGLMNASMNVLLMKIKSIMKVYLMKAYIAT